MRRSRCSGQHWCIERCEEYSPGVTWETAGQAGDKSRSRDLAVGYSDFSAFSNYEEKRANTDAIGDEPPRQRVVAPCDELLQRTGKDALDAAPLLAPARMVVKMQRSSAPAKPPRSVDSWGKDVRHAKQPLQRLPDQIASPPGETGWFLEAVGPQGSGATAHARGPHRRLRRRRSLRLHRVVGRRCFSHFLRVDSQPLVPGLGSRTAIRANGRAGEHQMRPSPKRNSPAGWDELSLWHAIEM
ncbi:hypothetical protein EJ02DRAFT_419081 [Clathrospora elynae]|uniref:Uncharacterized protein n=1 Tax=Clathrospora elynae TaxID=706981 RepID=A0A6A5T2S6_9PLEO|nr:hypothetical protein EJ02DRAFT_419081 [Clathrospora elynae]